MAIYCPECYFTLSDKTLVCVRCGHIMYGKRVDDRNLYDMVLEQKNEGSIPLIAYKLMQRYGVSKAECGTLLNTPGSIILKGVYKCYINYIYDKFLESGYVMKFVPTSDKDVSPANFAIENELLEKSKGIQYKQKNRQCPRCSSKNLHIDKISAFFNGGYNWKHHCRNCGYTWKVK